MEYIWDLLVNLHWGAVGQIIMIDILLGGDNAVVIAMACRNLPHEQRAKGIFWGTAGAIALRVVLITFAVMLLDLPFLKAAGGLLLLWIGVKLLIPEFDSHEKIEGSSKLLGAIKTIIVADFVMSFDNVIAIAGAAQQAHEAHQTLLIIFGLVVSVPFIVFGSQIILKLLSLPNHHLFWRRPFGLDCRRHDGFGRLCCYALAGIQLHGTLSCLCCWGASGYHHRALYCQEETCRT